MVQYTSFKANDTCWAIDNSDSTCLFDPKKHDLDRDDADEDRRTLCDAFPSYSIIHETPDRLDLLHDGTDGARIRLMHHLNFYTIDLLISKYIGQAGIKRFLYDDNNPDSIKEFWSELAEISEKMISLLSGSNRQLHCKIHLHVEKYDPTCDCTILIHNLFGEKFGEKDIYGSTVSESNAFIWMELDRSYQVSSCDCSRILVLDSSLNEKPLGRLVWRLLDIETYMIMALRDAAKARENLRDLRKWQEVYEIK